MSSRQNVLSDSAAYVTVLDKHCERNAPAGRAFQPVLILVLLLLLTGFPKKLARY